MPEFIKGMELCRDFFISCAEPALKKNFPKLSYSAGLLGYGSDVLGYDDRVSTDHMWGPRFYLFLEKLSQKDEVFSCLCNNLPAAFRGYSVNFSEPDMNDGGVRHPEWVEHGPVSPLVFIDTWDGFLSSYLGISSHESPQFRDWLSFSEHKLLAVSSGQFFHDDLKLGDKAAGFKFYPQEVQMYLAASCWALIAQEQAFVKRTAIVGDELGSRIICCRICERLMRLCFLYSGRYAPYSKWFGTAFTGLNLPGGIKEAVLGAVNAPNIEERENNLVMAQKLVADFHDSLGLTDPVNAKVVPYFGRDIKVIYPDSIVEKIREKYPQFAKLPLMGSMSQLGNFTEVYDSADFRKKLFALY